jgi:hypothetical protein
MERIDLIKIVEGSRPATVTWAHPSQAGHLGPGHCRREPSVQGASTLDPRLGNVTGDCSTEGGVKYVPGLVLLQQVAESGVTRLDDQAQG